MSVTTLSCIIHPRAVQCEQHVDLCSYQVSFERSNPAYEGSAQYTTAHDTASINAHDHDLATAKNKRNEFAENGTLHVVTAYTDEEEIITAGPSKRSADKLGEDVLLSLVKAYSDESDPTAKREKRSKFADNNIIFIVLPYSDDNNANTSTASSVSKRSPEKLGEDSLLSLLKALLYTDGTDPSAKQKRSERAKITSSSSSSLTLMKLTLILLQHPQ